MLKIKTSRSAAKSQLEINHQVQKVGGVIVETVTAIEQQSQGVEQINAAAEQVSLVTQQNAANSEEYTSASEELHTRSKRTLNLINSYKLTISEKAVTHSAVTDGLRIFSSNFIT